MQYRKHVTMHMLDLLHDCDDNLFGKFAASLVLGLNHEQQHQELILTDISHALLYQEQYTWVRQYPGKFRPRNIQMKASQQR